MFLADGRCRFGKCPHAFVAQPRHYLRFYTPERSIRSDKAQPGYYISPQGEIKSYQAVSPFRDDFDYLLFYFSLPYYHAYSRDLFTEYLRALSFA